MSEKMAFAEFRLNISDLLLRQRAKETVTFGLIGQQTTEPPWGLADLPSLNSKDYCCYLLISCRGCDVSLIQSVCYKKRFDFAFGNCGSPFTSPLAFSTGCRFVSSGVQCP